MGPVWVVHPAAIRMSARAASRARNRMTKRLEEVTIVLSNCLSPRPGAGAHTRKVDLKWTFLAGASPPRRGLEDRPPSSPRFGIEARRPFSRSYQKRTN